MIKKCLILVSGKFCALSKDKSKALTKQQMVDKVLLGVRCSDASIASAKVNSYQNYRSDFDKAVDFMSGLISSIHATSQQDYATQHSGNKRQYVSAMGSNDQRGGRGRARQGGGRIGQRIGRSSSGRGRDSCGSGCGIKCKTYANNVDMG